MCCENKSADQLRNCVVTAQLICTFAFAYAKKRFSFDEAHVLIKCTLWFLACLANHHCISNEFKYMYRAK